MVEAGACGATEVGAGRAPNAATDDAAIGTGRRAEWVLRGAPPLAVGSGRSGRASCRCGIELLRLRPDSGLNAAGPTGAGPATAADADADRPDDGRLGSSHARPGGCRAPSVEDTIRRRAGFTLAAGRLATGGLHPAFGHGPGSVRRRAPRCPPAGSSRPGRTPNYRCRPHHHCVDRHPDECRPHHRFADHQPDNACRSGTIGDGRSNQGPADTPGKPGDRSSGLAGGHRGRAAAAHVLDRDDGIGPHRRGRHHAGSFRIGTVARADNRDGRSHGPGREPNPGHERDRRRQHPAAGAEPGRSTDNRPPLDHLPG
jgi:hypothetical protein